MDDMKIDATTIAEADNVEIGWIYAEDDTPAEWEPISFLNFDGSDEDLGRFFDTFNSGIRFRLLMTKDSPRSGHPQSLSRISGSNRNASAFDDTPFWSVSSSQCRSN